MPNPRRYYYDDPIAALDQMWSRISGDTRVYIGIDPGYEGAMAFVPTSDLTPPVVLDLPTLKTKVNTTKKGKAVKGVRTEYNYAQIADYMATAIPHRERVVVALERGQPMVRSVKRCKCCHRGFGDTAKTGFAVGVGYGMWLLYLSSLGFAREEISPASWKIAMKLSGKGKEAARSMALKLFPRSSQLLSCKGDHNRAEAMLLTTYLRRLHQGGFNV